MSYLVLKLLHIASVVVFLGNITTGLYWARRAHRTGELSLVASTFDGIIRSDRWFTVPGVVGILVTGFAMAIVARTPILGTGWVLWPVVLFSVSGVVFGVWVAPLQRRILESSLEASSANESWPEYDATFRRWEMWGLVALVTPVAAMVIMVIKPSLPGL